MLSSYVTLHLKNYPLHCQRHLNEPARITTERLKSLEHFHIFQNNLSFREIGTKRFFENYIVKKYQEIIILEHILCQFLGVAVLLLPRQRRVLPGPPPRRPLGQVGHS